MRLPVAVAMIVVVSSGVAFGATRKVPQQFPTITAALAAAAPGDTIAVDKGTRFENVTVNVADVKIVGRGKSTIVDARTSNLEGSGPAFVIAANGVTIQNLTVRHAKSTGPGAPPAVGSNIVISGTLANVTLRGVRSLHCELAHVSTESSVANLVIERCSFEGGSGLELIGTNVLIKKCSFLRNDFALFVSIEDSEIRENVFQDIAFGGLLHADDSIVQANRFLNVRSPALMVLGDGYTLSSNSFQSCGFVLAGGSNATIKSNTFLHFGIGGEAIEEFPQAALVLDTASAIDVRGNTFKDAAGPGLWLTDSATNCVVASNSVKRCGGAFGLPLFGGSGGGSAVVPKHAGIYVQADGTMIDGNKVSECAGDGILVIADACTVINNIAASNLEDGIDVDGASTSVLNNVCKSNHAEGLDLSGDGATITTNKCSGNRVNWRQDGVPAVILGNTPAAPDTSDPCVDHD